MRYPTVCITGSDSSKQNKNDLEKFIQTEMFICRRLFHLMMMMMIMMIITTTTIFYKIKVQKSCP